MKTFIITTEADITETGAAVRAAFANGPVRVVVSRHEKEQTTPQRRYLEFCFQFIANESHQDRDTVREAILDSLLGEDTRQVTLANGKTWRVRRRRSSTELNSRAMAEIITAVQQYAQENLDLHIPDPNDAVAIADADARYDK